MKEGLIRLTDEKNIFYDQQEKRYRYRMHCEMCGKVSGCRCFNTLEEVEKFRDDGVEYICSSRCSLAEYIDNEGTEDIEAVMKNIDHYNTLYLPKIEKLFVSFLNLFTWMRLKWYVYRYLHFDITTEDDAYRILTELDLDYDSIEGDSC